MNLRYYKLMYDYENDADAICAESDDLKGIDRYDVEKGKKIENWPEITFYYNPEEGSRKTDYLGNDLGWFVISERFKNILQEEKIEGIQYLPINIVNIKTNEKLGNYFVVNVCNLVEALDLDNSVYDVFEIDENRKYILVVKYALKAELIKGLDIFRLKEEDIPIYVSERFVDTVKKYGMTGFDFLKVKVS